MGKASEVYPLEKRDWSSRRKTWFSWMLREELLTVSQFNPSLLVDENEG